MKNRLCIFGALALVMILPSCSLDNYDYPNSGLHGSIIDKQTGELVEQDIIEGSVLNFIELGYSNPAIQKMVIKNNGEYKNSMMFAGKYKIFTSQNANFAPIDTIVMNIKGQMKLDIEVVPFVRITNPMVFLSGNKVRATFTITQTGFDNLMSVALFASSQSVVGEYMSDAKVVIPVGLHYAQPKSFTIDMNLADYKQLKTGKSYYFRIGALVAVGGAKYNYAPAVKVDL